MIESGTAVKKWRSFSPPPIQSRVARSDCFHLRGFGWPDMCSGRLLHRISAAMRNGRSLRPGRFRYRQTMLSQQPARAACATNQRWISGRPGADDCRAAKASLPRVSCFPQVPTSTSDVLFSSLLSFCPGAHPAMHLSRAGFFRPWFHFMQQYGVVLAIGAKSDILAAPRFWPEGPCPISEKHHVNQYFKRVLWRMAQVGNRGFPANAARLGRVLPRSGHRSAPTAG
jgi:hypothetical protein